jgi:aspartate aminotransferase-like enzyme
LAVTGSQKALSLPTGLALVCATDKVRVSQQQGFMVAALGCMVAAVGHLAVTGSQKALLVVTGLALVCASDKVRVSQQQGFLVAALGCLVAAVGHY